MVESNNNTQDLEGNIQLDSYEEESKQPQGT